MHMKKNLLVIFLFSFLGLFGQLPEGVNQLTTQQTGSSFVFKDKSGTVWIGLGSMNNGTGRYSNGLKKYKNNVLSTVYPTGIFTDALEVDKTVFFTAYEG